MSCNLIYVSAGAAEYRWVKITENDGGDISGDTVQLALVQYPGIPAVSDWQAPDDTDVVSSSVIRSAMLIDDTFAPGVYQLWSRLTDSPEIIPEPAGVIQLK